MKRVVYVHGLGGSGNGTSAGNVKTAVKKMYEKRPDGEKIEFSAGTYNLLNPLEAFHQIENDVKDADLIVASSLGAFYVSAVHLNELQNPKVILLNPCLNPNESIPGLLYEDQKAGFDQDKCLREWDEIKGFWNELSVPAHSSVAGIFSKGDEYFHYQKVFEKYFKTYSVNLAEIEGVHEIAKHTDQLENALSEAEKILENNSRLYDKDFLRFLQKIHGEDE